MTDKCELAQNIFIASVLIIGGIASTFQALYPRWSNARRSDLDNNAEAKFQAAQFVIDDSKILFMVHLSRHTYKICRVTECQIYFLDTF